MRLRLLVRPAQDTSASVHGMPPPDPHADGSLNTSAWGDDQLGDELVAP